MFTPKVLRQKGYRITRLIGEGSFSKVKLARSQTRGSEVAIKIVNGNLISPDVATRFLPRELELLNIISHENIVRVFEIIESHNGKVYIAMEPAASDLLQRINEVGRMSVDESRTIFTQTVNAVRYLHQNNIVHRDLKCENMLLMSDGRVKITHFGFGRFSMGYPDLSSTYCGTLAYAPPEVVKGIPNDPQKHDVWSMGVILYFMVAGCQPYDDSSPDRLIEAQGKPVVYPDDLLLPASCQASISYLLHYAPSTRPRIQQVAQHSWLQQAAENNNEAQ
ncbi:testis-specific serine/threonine-protein kinase 6-like [Lampris incognitus]|uniref:testis-specific serine/threonine-protein kinase 6-like n=1 Tax=Lampris incognitus TaxID=2546036 RepID=UPI0024B61D4E|nr:testis-specific serine/threonine-protein kinase 6-like [Lampris incognitus]